MSDLLNKRPQISLPDRSAPLALSLKVEAETIYCYTALRCRDVCGLHENKSYSLKHSFTEVKHYMVVIVHNIMRLTVSSHQGLIHIYYWINTLK